MKSTMFALAAAFCVGTAIARERVPVEGWSLASADVIFAESSREKTAGVRKFDVKVNGKVVLLDRL